MSPCAKLTPVILCGGSGTRLWPLSRTSYPKQLLPLFEGKSLLQQTLLRLRELPNLNSALIICNQEYRFIIAEQVRALGFDDAKIILEPEGRNTAPATTVAALMLQASHPDNLMLVLPADHVINDYSQFTAAVELAVQAAEQGRLVTFGVKPTKPETGYGYIQKGPALAEDIFQVQQFVEKPDLATAEKYLHSGEYFWNSGMFLFSVKDFLAEMKVHAADILEASLVCFKEIQMDHDFYRISAEIFKLCRSESLDYAVMEKSKNIAVVPLYSDWSDLGSWSALWELYKPDASGNVIKGDVIAQNVNNSYLHSESRLVAIVGVSDLIVVETADAVMVAHKDKCQEVKHLVNSLKEHKRIEVERHGKPLLTKVEVAL